MVGKEVARERTGEADGFVAKLREASDPGDEEARCFVFVCW